MRPSCCGLHAHLGCVRCTNRASSTVCYLMQPPLRTSTPPHPLIYQYPHLYTNLHGEQCSNFSFCCFAVVVFCSRFAVQIYLLAPSFPPRHTRATNAPKPQHLLNPPGFLHSLEEAFKSIPIYTPGTCSHACSLIWHSLLTIRLTPSGNACSLNLGELTSTSSSISFFPPGLQEQLFTAISDCG